ncbi:hypothetical protein BCV69DRAFT_168824 [Microstroma glucosiphilum]|uniref:Uncharacterized protein n=1 Tax=Pseudomicrostroma glucosiphilum TaxID=1684307 RepID=A0A316U823_9BASI|nr:hypothetical protein BCV69DRAFT_168824 [Pseudomicrostroma glucosiphilum]PWN21387.1 hypothetical protein BCV69DRAFT_168824 [Pseudomicrostroma glucosiphilum]
MPMSSTAALSSRSGMPPSNAASRAMRPAQPPPTSTSDRARSSTATSASSSRATSAGASASSSSTVPAKRPIASVRTQSSTTTSTKRPHADSRPGSASSSRHASVAKEPTASRTAERSRSKTPVPSSIQASRERAARDREMSLDELAQGLPTQSSLRSSPFKRPAVVDPSERRRQVFRQIKVDLQRSERDGISIFPAIPASPAEARSLQRRLFGLVECYLDPSLGDLTSASFYSFLFLTLFPQSVDARRLRAKCLLLAGQGAIFPLLQERSQRGGAVAALAILEQGPVDIFGDLGCAQIWSEACKALGRRSEAEEVLAWCLQNATISSSSQPALPEEEMPELVGLDDRKAAAGLTQLGYLQKDAKQLEAATHHFMEARKRDPWNWGAWVGLCELDTAPEAKDAFASSQIRHAPTDFLDAVMISLGGIPTSESDLDNTMTGATSRTVAPVPQLKNGEASSARTSALTSQTAQRPGSRPTTTAGSGTANGVATAKRTKATPTTTTGSKRPVFGPGSAAAAFGIEGGGTEAQRSTTVTSRGPKPTTMNRTLSQARTNERPPSSLSSGSRSTVSEKEKPQQLKDTSLSVSRDSLRRSTRTDECARGPSAEDPVADEAVAAS